MPFSMAAIKRNLNYSLQFYQSFASLRISASLVILKIVTLQVRILNNRMYSCQGCRGRKAFLSVSASLTLEAVLAWSVFLFAAVSLMLPMKIMNTERKVQAGLEAVGEELSQYAYIQDAMEQNDRISIQGADRFEQEFGRSLKGRIVLEYAQAQVMKHADTKSIQNATMLQSEIRQDGEHFDLVLQYEIRMPFPILGLNAVERTARCRRRAWIGKEGEDNEQAAGSGADEDEIVYIGKSSTRYHRDRGCHYLANNLTAIPYEQLGDRRNDSGSKYRACAVCAKIIKEGDTVYITPNGRSFHASKLCTAITAYVRTVRLREVEHLGPCSYCSQ